MLCCKVGQNEITFQHHRKAMIPVSPKRGLAEHNMVYMCASQILFPSSNNMTLFVALNNDALHVAAIFPHDTNPARRRVHEAEVAPSITELPDLKTTELSQKLVRTKNDSSTKRTIRDGP